MQATLLRTLLAMYLKPDSRMGGMHGLQKDASPPFNRLAVSIPLHSAAFVIYSLVSTYT